MSVPNTRINVIEQIEQALRTLTSQGYDTSALWTEHNAWLEAVDGQKPTDEDVKWATRTVDSSIQEHFVDGVPETLSAARCVAGWQYSLSPGQRTILRERCGMTPTKEVIVENVSMFTGTNIIWSITLRSTEHVDPRRRKVLNAVVLQPASTFFSTASALDKEHEATLAEDDAKSSKPKRQPGKVELAMQYI